MTKDEQSYAKELLHKLEIKGWDRSHYDSFMDLLYLECCTPNYEIFIDVDHIGFIDKGYARALILDDQELMLFKRLCDLVHSKDDLKLLYEFTKENNHE